MLRVLLVTLALSPFAGLALLATGGPTDAAPPLAPSAPGTAPWDLLDCFFAYASVPVDSVRMAERIPPGFSLQAPVPVRVSGGPASVANMGFEIDVCASGEGLAGRVEPMEYASVWVAASPPARLREADAGTGYFLAYDILVPDADRRAWLAGVGAPVHDGDVVVTATERGFRAEWTLEGVGTFAIDAVTSDAAPAGPAGGRFTQFQPTQDGGLVRWSTDWSASSSQRAVAALVTVPEGSWYADVVGASTFPAQAFYGRWDYTAGDIEPLA